jgi:lysine 2,3-aminomutase
LTGNAARTVEDVAARYRVAVSDYLLDHIGANASGPLGRQYLPDTRELDRAPADRADPIGDAAHSPVPGIVHRYPNRVLLMPLETCAVYCRFCFRRERVGQAGHGLLSDADLTGALGYIAHTPAIREVILTGGDPFILSPRRLETILGALAKIDHVKIVRFHTRVPVADPKRVTDTLCTLLGACEKTLYVVTHVNHADELTPAAERTFHGLRRAGCILLSQSVLLKGINDTAEALAALFQGLAERGVKPYYLHHPDLAEGTGHFRLPPEIGQALMRDVRAQVSGLAMPLYVLDIPGGYGKVPIQSCHIRQEGDAYTVVDGKGHRHEYDPGVAA